MVAILVVGATVFALVSIHALWANRQFLNTDNWTKTSSELLQREAVRTQVADFLVDQLYAHVNVRGELESALPPQAKALAGPVAGGLRNVADQGINKLLQRPRVQQLWENANRAAHKAFLKTIEGGGKNVSTTGGNVKLNLGQIAASVATSLGLGNVASKIPPDAAQITVLKSNQLEAVQNGFKALRGITLVVVLLTLLLYVIAVVVARDRRRQALRMVGWSLIVAGVLALLVRTFVGQQVVDSLSTTASVRAAVSDTWDVASSLLVQAAQSTIAYGVVVVLGAWLAGPTRPAVAVRHFLAPFLHSPRWAFGSVAVVVLLLLALGPDAGHAQAAGNADLRDPALPRRRGAAPPGQARGSRRVLRRARHPHPGPLATDASRASPAAARPSRRRRPPARPRARATWTSSSAWAGSRDRRADRRGVREAEGEHPRRLRRLTGAWPPTSSSWRSTPPSIRPCWQPW